MTHQLQHPVHGEIVCKVNYWTGKTEVSINGIKLIRQKKNDYLYNGTEGPQTVVVRADLFVGVIVTIANEQIRLAKPATWYEMACSLSIMVVLILWGNTPSLYRILPMVGGAVGGALGGMMTVVCAITMMRVKNIAAKLGIWLGMLAGTLLAGWLCIWAIVAIFT